MQTSLYMWLAGSEVAWLITSSKSVWTTSSPMLQPSPVASLNALQLMHDYFNFMMNDLPRDLKLFCRKFAYEIKFGGRSDNFHSIQLDLDRTTNWTDSNCMLLTIAKSQNLHLVSKNCPTLSFPDSNGVSIPVLQAHHTKDLGIIVDSSLRPTA